VRIAYYGDIVPNPVRAKAPSLKELAPGALYVGKIAASYPLVFLAALRARPRIPSKTWKAMVAAVAIQFAFATIAGGDHFAGHRLLVAVSPRGALLPAAGIGPA